MSALPKVHDLARDSDVASLAAHKREIHDLTNASHNPLGLIVPNRRGTLKGKQLEDDSMLAGDLTHLKRQQTQAKARKSIFVPKKAAAKQYDKLDSFNMTPKGNSDDEDGKNEGHGGTEGRFNIKKYNRERKYRLNRFEYSMDSEPAEEG